MVHRFVLGPSVRLSAIELSEQSTCLRIYLIRHSVALSYWMCTRGKVFNSLRTLELVAILREKQGQAKPQMSGESEKCRKCCSASCQERHVSWVVPSISRYERVEGVRGTLHVDR